MFGRDIQDIETLGDKLANIFPFAVLIGGIILAMIFKIIGW